jgi:hypothetical protein
MKGKMNGGGGKSAKTEKKVEKGITLKQRAEQLGAAKGLSKLDVLEKPLKTSARKQLIKSQMKKK